MPEEVTRHAEILAAIERTEAISELVESSHGQYRYELDLEVIVYGRNYNGKKVGPYLRLIRYEPGEEIVREGDWGGNSFFILVDGVAEVFLSRGGKEEKVGEILAGTQFGEMSVLAGVPRAATVRAPRDRSISVIEIDRPALRLLRKLSRFGEILDANYRRNGRVSTLQDLSAATDLKPHTAKQLEAISRFRVFSKNHVLFRAGAPVKHLYIIRSGWARLTDPSHQSTSQLIAAPPADRTGHEKFIGSMQCLGQEGIIRDLIWPRSCILLGRAEVLEISISRLRQLPEIREEVITALRRIAVDADEAPERVDPSLEIARREIIATGLVDANNLLVMAMELCVRCGNCSMACHQVHGRSRLVRRGINIRRPPVRLGQANRSTLAPEVCLHCQDPECLTGCPTGAIQRFPGGQVDIDAKTCIGCADCATQCPYNAITMVPRQSPQTPHRSDWRDWFRLSAERLPPAVEQTEDLLAVKCNLCAGTSLNPPGARSEAYSCEENCPTGALLRVDPQIYFAEIRDQRGPGHRAQNEQIARRDSHHDRLKSRLHLSGALLALIVCGAALWGITRSGLETPFAWGWLDWRWMTGVIGSIFLGAVMTYAARRRIYRRRAGPLRYWLIAHAYCGVIAAVLFLLHGGLRSGGALTTSLMISFDLVILTGLFAIFCYYVIPRMLVRIEEQPLLIEDLVSRREELEGELSDLIKGAREPARAIFRRRILPRIISLRSLIEQMKGRLDLEAMLLASHREFEPYFSGLTPEDRDRLVRAVEVATTMRRIDALIYLHRLLRVWIAPHVLTTAVMLSLLVVHVVQVVYFAAR